MLLKKALIVFILAVLSQACAQRPQMVSTNDAFQRFIEDRQNQEAISRLSNYLRRARVDHVVPLDQLLQQGTDWNITREPRYVIPPESLWPNMIQTLKLLDRFVIPAIGPIQVVSGFRTPAYNQLVGGAQRSRHLDFSALDVIPRLDMSRNALHKKMLQLWRTHGSQLNMGLGLYTSNRIHIDTGGYRKWQG